MYQKYTGWERVGKRNGGAQYLRQLIKTSKSECGLFCKLLIFGPLLRWFFSPKTTKMYFGEGLDVSTVVLDAKKI
ncbi:MAG: hypothetical protein D3923_03555 [Candidatus Electrothrix sp. AR3]|nr:hypothetical protein [Candidatus Electrothrix sp. AR3]